MRGLRPVGGDEEGADLGHPPEPFRVPDRLSLSFRETAKCSAVGPQAAIDIRPTASLS